MAQAGEVSPLLDQAAEVGRMLNGPQALAALRRLTPASFPLALTTDHCLQVTVNGVDVFVPNSGDIRTDTPDKNPLLVH